LKKSKNRAGMPKYHYEREEPFSPEEVAQYLKRANGLRDQALLSLLYLTGCRISEALDLRGEDVQISEDELSIRVRPKKAEKHGPLKPSSKVFLERGSIFTKPIERWVRKRKAKEPLFDISRVRAWRIVKDLTGTSPHFFRRTRIMRMVRKGYSLDDARRWVGRKTLPVEYSEASEEEMRRIGRNID